MIKRIKTFWDFITRKKSPLKKLQNYSGELAEVLNELKANGRREVETIKSLNKKIKTNKQKLLDRAKLLKSKGEDIEAIKKDDVFKALTKRIAMLKKHKSTHSKLGKLILNSIKKVDKTKSLVDQIIIDKSLKKANNVLNDSSGIAKGKNQKALQYDNANIKYQGLDFSDFHKPSNENVLSKKPVKSNRNKPKQKDTYAEPIISTRKMRY